MADTTQIGSKGGQPTVYPTGGITKGGEGEYGGLGPSGGQPSSSSFGGNQNSKAFVDKSSKNDSGASKLIAPEKPTSYTQNYGYTPDVTPAPIVSQNFSKNPLENDLGESGIFGAKGGKKTQAGGGGVETPQSKELGSRYSWESLSGKSENIGTKIFTNQKQFTRDSSLEQQTKANEAERSSSIFVSKANPNYGKPSPDQVFGGVQTKESQGKSFDTGNRLVRNTPFEAKTKSDEEKRVTNQFYNSKNEEKSAFFSSKASNGTQTILIDPLTGLPTGNTKPEQQARANYFGSQTNGKPDFISIKNQPTPKSSESVSDVFAFAEKNNIKSLDVYDLAGNKLGSVKANQNGLDFVNQIGSENGLIVRTPPSSSVGNLSNIGAIASKGGVISVFDQNGKPLGQAAGSNAELTFAKLTEKGGGKVTYSILYPEAEKEIISSAKQNPTFFESLSNSYYQNAGKSGFISAKGIESLNSIFKEDYFIKNSNLAVKSTLDKSTTPIDIVNTRGGVYHGKVEGNQIVGEPAYQGHYVDTSLGPNWLPNFINQGIEKTKQGLATPPSIISPWTKYEEFGKNFAAFFVQGAKSTAIIGSALAREGYDLARTGKATDKTISPTPSAFLTGIYYPQDLFSSKAQETSAKVQSGIHNVAKPLGVSGIVPVENAQTFGATAGSLAGLGVSVYGFKGIVPLRGESIPVKIGLEAKSSPAFPLIVNSAKEEARQVPMSRSLVFGYGGVKQTPSGELVYQGRELISKTATGVKFGKLEPQDYFPEGYVVKSQATRGEEFATGKNYPVSKLTSNAFQEYAESTGRSIPGTAKATQNFLELKSLADTKGEYIQYKKEIPTSNERITSQVGKVTLETNAKLYPARNALLKLFSTGRGAVGQGSTFGNLFVHPDVLPKTEQLAPVHDIDFVKGNAVSETNPITAFFNDRQARALASTVQSNIEKEQGIQEQTGVGFHATGSISEARDITANPTTQKSKRGGFFVMNRASAIGQFGNKVLKVEFNPEDVLFYKNIPKSERKSLIPKDKNWLQYQKNVMNYALSKGYNIVEKPYYNTKRGAGTNPEANTREVIFINEASLKSIKNIELLPKMQLTEAIGSKIWEAKAKGEKLVEFITKSDTENEVGSAMKPTGNILGKPINFKVFKTPIEGSKVKGPHYGGQHAEETGLSQILALQTSETVKEQGTAKGNFGDLGSKFFVGPKLFGEGKELVRTLGKFETKAIEFKSNPKTKETGERMDVLIQEQKEYYGNLYGVDFNKPVTGSAFERPSSYFKGPSKASEITKSGNLLNPFLSYNPPSLSISPNPSNPPINSKSNNPPKFNYLEYLRLGDAKNNIIEARGRLQNALNEGKITNEQFQKSDNFLKHQENQKTFELMDLFGMTNKVHTKPFLKNTQFNRSFLSSDFHKPSSYFKGSSTKSDYQSGGSKGSLVFKSRPSFSEKSTLSKPSERQSQRSGYSIFSGKSNLSGKSQISGKSTKSGLSGLSSISVISGKSEISSLSVASSLSAPSGASGPSGSATSSLSGLSGPSAKSGLSGSSFFSGSKSIITPLSILPSVRLGDLGRKRKIKVREGPTALIHLGTKNVFAPSFNIEIPRNKRYEF